MPSAKLSRRKKHLQWECPARNGSIAKDCAAKLGLSATKLDIIDNLGSIVPDACALFNLAKLAPLAVGTRRIGYAARVRRKRRPFLQLFVFAFVLERLRLGLDLVGKLVKLGDRAKT